MNRLMTLCAIAALAVAGCGGGSDKTTSTAAPAGTTSTQAGSGGGGTLQLAALKDGFKFDKTSLKAPAGSVTISMKNDSGLSHNVSIQGQGVDKNGNTVGQGGTSKVTADLKAGTYTFYCSVTGHEAAGMKGTLTIK
jgi:plastocyanin